MQQEYDYYAFISYSHADEKVARWLQDSLEGYRLPAIIRKEIPRLPKRVRPIFRDKTDLGAGVLNTGILKELERSRYLIVLCSPDSAKSDWVGREISYFKQMGRFERIIPVIARGVPFAKEEGEEECFHEALVDDEKELLGININEIGRSRTLIKVIARLLDVRFDSLWGRERRRQRMQNILRSIAAVLCCMLAMVAWQYWHSEYEYYADYVDCKGSPMGIIPLSEDAIEHREFYYKFEKRRASYREDNFWDWQVASVSYVNSADVPQEHWLTDHQDRFSIQRLTYEHGVLKKITYCDRYGKVLLHHEVINDEDGTLATAVNLMQSDGSNRGSTIAARTMSMTSRLTDKDKRKANIVHFIYVRNGKGYIIKKTFHESNALDSSNSIICDQDGIAGMLYERDDDGRVLKLRFINEKGEPIEVKNAGAGCDYTYDAFGNIETRCYRGLDGEPVTTELGWAKFESFSNPQGNQTLFAYYGPDEAPCRNKSGYSKSQIEYDDRGFPTRRQFFDEQGKLVMRKNGYAQSLREHDQDGNTTRWQGFDEKGNPCMREGGFSSYRAEYNKKGQMVRQLFYNTRAELCCIDDGYAICKYTYDDEGNLKSEAYFDEDGDPCAHIEGYASVHYQYYPHNHFLKAVTYLSAKERHAVTKSLYSHYEIKYDNFGNIKRQDFYQDDKYTRCMTAAGFAYFTQKHDEYGHLIEECYFDTYAKPCMFDGGYAKKMVTYGADGLVTELYFDADGQEIPPPAPVEGS